MRQDFLAFYFSSCAGPVGFPCAKLRRLHAAMGSCFHQSLLLQCSKHESNFFEVLVRMFALYMLDPIESSPEILP